MPFFLTMSVFMLTVMLTKLVIFEYSFVKGKLTIHFKSLTNIHHSSFLTMNGYFMALHLILEDTNSPFKVYYWLSKILEDFDWPMKCPNTTAQEIEKFARIVRKYVLQGKFPADTSQFKYIESDLWEIKPSKQLRLIGSFAGKRFIIFNCIRKKNDKIPKQVLVTTRAILKQVKECI